MRSAQAAKLPPQCRKSLLERTPLSICRAMLFLPTQRGIIGSANTLPGLVCIGDTWSSLKFLPYHEMASIRRRRQREKRRALDDTATSILAGSQWGDLVLSVGRPASACWRSAVARRCPAIALRRLLMDFGVGRRADLKSHGRASAASAMLAAEIAGIRAAIGVVGPS
jgi:hypothetical protein